MKLFCLGLFSFISLAGLSADQMANSSMNSVSAADMQSSNKNATNVTADALKSMMDSGVDMVIVDARTKEFDDGNRIKGAIFLPCTSTDQEIMSALPSKDKQIVVYCVNMKCPASKTLGDRLMNMGYMNVMECPEGIVVWMQKGYPAEKAQK